MNLDYNIYSFDINEPVDSDETDLDNRIMFFLSNPLITEHLFRYQEIPDDFWEPVIISLQDEQKSLLKNKLFRQECIICNEDSYNYKILPCCTNDMCHSCMDTWFDKSIKCPYCNQDLRDFI